jgi:hypothetical protein
MFFVLGALLASIVAWCYVTRGPRFAVAVACGCALLFPAWVAVNLGPTLFNLRSFGCLVALVIVAVTSFRLLPGGISITDVIVLAIATSQVTTEYNVGNLTASTWMSALVEWIVPYLLGRIAFESVHDLKRLTAIMAWVCLGLSTLAIIESITKVNVLNLVFAHVGSLQGETDIRWGLKRAEGPVSHPIFFGLVLVMILPWALEAARRAKDGDGPRWWLATPWLTGIAACCPMSRGPQIGVMACLLLTVFLRFPAWRRGLATAAIVLGISGAVAYKPLIELLHIWSNENQKPKETVVIAGRPVEYSGTNHRVLQLSVYQEAALNAGWGGYGLLCMSTKPSKIPYVEEHLREMFFSIDNHYLWMLLRAGFGGIALFVLLGVSALCLLIRPALTLDAPHSLLAGGLFASILVVMVLVTTVFFAADFGFLWLFNIGLSGSLRKSFNSRKATSTALLVTPRLAPGHPLCLPFAAPSNSPALQS